MLLAVSSCSQSWAPGSPLALLMRAIFKTKASGTHQDLCLMPSVQGPLLLAPPPHGQRRGCPPAGLLAHIPCPGNPPGWGGSLKEEAHLSKPQSHCDPG